MGGFRDLSIRRKLVLTYSTAILAAFLVGMVFLNMQVSSMLEEDVRRDLEHATLIVKEMIDGAIHVGYKNNLRAVSEINLQLTRDIYAKYQQGELSEREAKEQIAGYLLKQKVGSEGYPYIIDTLGNVIVHPNPELIGQNLSDRPPVDSQVVKRHGFVEYLWPAKDSSVLVRKEVYMLPFKPWGWLISTSAYVSDFDNIVRPEDFREHILGLHHGDSGYSYVLNTKGELIIHPHLEGRTSEDITFINEQNVIDTMLENLSGTMTYMWNDPGSDQIREKVVYYDYIPEVEWIVASSFYKDESYMILSSVQRVIFIFIIATLLLIVLLSIFISNRISAPVMRLTAAVKPAQSIRKSVPVVKDEVRQLELYFEEYLAQLHQQNAEIRRNEEMMLNMIEGTRDYAFIMLNPRGEIINWNDGASRLTGYREAEAVTQHFSIFLSTEHSVQWAMNALLDEAVNNGKYEEEGKWYHKAGNSFIAHVVISPIKNNKNILEGFSIVMRDITERKLAEKIVEESERKFKSIVENTPISMIMYELVNNELYVIELNPAALRTVGIPAEEAMGKRITELFPNFINSPLLPKYRKIAREGGQHLTAELPYGDEKFAGTFFVNVFQTSPNRLAIFFDDISERKNQEKRINELNEQLSENIIELKRSNKELEQFAYIASHDLQEPLRGMSSSIQIVKNRLKDLDEETQKFMDFVVDGSARMQQLIQDMLKYSRVQTEAGEFEEVDMQTVVSNVQQNLKLLIEEANVEFITGDLPVIKADAAQMQQLLQNLVHNAIKFRSDNPLLVKINCDKEQRHWVFSVSDNGIGIQKEYHERIFKIFKRLHSRKEYTGTGIGLAICDRIVDRHGGKIWVESEPGLGSTFYFSILKGEELRYEQF